MSERTGVLAVALTAFSLVSSPFPVLLIISYLVHEAGHLAFSRIVGAEMKKFKVGPLRLCLSYDCSHISYKREMLVQAGGVMFNLFLAALVYLLPFFSGEKSTFFIVCNLSLGAMNLYPISILDGGGLLKSLLLQLSSGDVAEKACKMVSFVATILLWFVAVYLQIVFSSDLSLFVISVLLLVELCFSFM